MLNRIAFWLLCCSVFAMPWEESLKIVGDSRMPALAGIGAFGVALVSVLLHFRLRVPRAFLLAAFTFVAWSALCFFWAFDTRWTIERVTTYAQLFLMAWLIWELAGDPHRQAILLQSYVAGAFVAAGDMVHNYLNGVNYISSGGYGHESFTSGSFRPNDLGFMLVLALPMAWYLAVRHGRGLMMWVNRLYIPFGMIGIFLTASRGALIPAVVALMLIPLTLGKMKLRSKAMILVIAVLAVPMTIAVVPQASWDRLSTTKSDLESGTLTHRREIWRAGFQVFMQRPVGGVGPGNFEVAAGAYLDRPRPAHNAFIAVAVEQGIIGLVLFTALFVVGLPNLRFMPRLERRFWCVLMLTLFVGLQPRNWDYKKPTWLVLTVFAAAGAAAREHAQREARRSRQWHMGPVRPMPVMPRKPVYAANRWITDPAS